MWSKPYIIPLPNSCEEVCVCVGLQGTRQLGGSTVVCVIVERAIGLELLNV